MQIKRMAAMTILGLFSANTTLYAAEEILIPETQSASMSVSIYNNNLGFIRDTRSVELTTGNNAIAFEGVSGQIKAETAMLSGDNISVLEQNYDYDLVTPYNLLDKFVGKEVKTILQNPTTGANIFDKAVVINNNSGSPILRFDYGIETAFPGRVVFDKIPTGLRVKPTLVATINSKNAGKQDLELAYLTNGISWKADYVAEVLSENKLNLNTWITLKNETGADYKNASVQLISGSVNQAVSYGISRPMMLKAARGMLMDNAVTEAGGVERTNISDYYLYKLPEKTTIKDKQSKQVSMMNLQNVKYEKEYVFLSPLSLNIGIRDGDFEKLNPNVVFRFENDKTSNLGEPLPAGIVRFYEKDAYGNLQFIGENNINQTAVGEKIMLTVGKSFDIFASGKIVNVRNISKDINEFDVEITFNNASSEDKKIIFEQNVYNKWDLLKENMKSEHKNASTLEWKFDLPKDNKKVLTYTVRVNRNR